MMDPAIISLSPVNQLTVLQAQGFEGSHVSFGDYIKLAGLQPGDLIYLKDDGSGEKVIMIGNATPYNGVSSTSAEGWDYGIYNGWEVKSVYRLVPSQIFLHPEEVDVVKLEVINDLY